MMCRTLGVSRSGYYAWRHRKPSQRAQQDATLGAQIQQVHQHSRGTYGRPRVHAALRARGVQTSAKRVGRLMKQQGLHARRRRRFGPTTDSTHTLPVAPNVLERRFQVQAPDVAWVGDITYIPTAQGFLYLGVLLDLFSRCVVGWSMGATLERSLCLSALQLAVQRRNPEPGLAQLCLPLGRLSRAPLPPASPLNGRYRSVKPRPTSSGLSRSTVVASVLSPN
jgi:transposase InsO family protein